MSKVNIDSKTNLYFPNLNKSATWEDAWESCQKYGFEVEIYDRVIPKTRPCRYSLEIILSKETDKGDNILQKFELTGEERMNYTPLPTAGDFDLMMIYKLCVDFLIQNKYIKKPKNSCKIQAQKSATLEDLKKQRGRLAMKIHSWKKQNKDITELEKQRDTLNKQIKSLS